MIEIDESSREHFAKVMEFAMNNGCADKLLERLQYLAEYAGGRQKCVLYTDWAPNSFAFAMKKPDSEFWFNGGLIYSGPGQPLDGSAPAFTVSIDADSSKHSWSIHT